MALPFPFGVDPPFVERLRLTPLLDGFVQRRISHREIDSG
jgi:hypothetical protein